jgi:hypothetical protein
MRKLGWEDRGTDMRESLLLLLVQPSSEGVFVACHHLKEIL